MTALSAMIMECRAIEGDDRLILFGWSAQLEEDNTLLYCSKETVADFLVLSVRTIQRRTKRLVKLGLMADTGEQKLWNTGWTPVYTINVPMIVELCKAQEVDSKVGDKMSPRQIVVQGSNGSMVLGLGVLSISSEATSTELRSEVVKSVPPQSKAETENQKPKTNGKTNPKTKSCHKCGQAWSRDKNHTCPDPEDFMDMPKIPVDSDPMQDGWGNEESVFTDGWKPKVLRYEGIRYEGAQFEGAQASKSEGSAASQGNGSMARDGKSNPDGNGLHKPPVSADPPRLVNNDAGVNCKYCFQPWGQPHHKTCFHVTGRLS